MIEFYITNFWFIRVYGILNSLGFPFYTFKAKQHHQRLGFSVFFFFFLVGSVMVLWWHLSFVVIGLG